MQVPFLPPAAGAVGASAVGGATDRAERDLLETNRQRHIAPAQPELGAVDGIEAGHSSEDRGGNGQEPWQQGRANPDQAPAVDAVESNEGRRPALTEGGGLLDLDA
jgi:hypothetical protein